jgi:Domain of unknown function (DUF4276)
VVSTQIFVEGGRNNSDAMARQGFSQFFKRAGVKMLPRVVICGSRGDAIRDYRNRRGPAVLLVDSEQAVTAATKIQHLLDRGDIDATHQNQLSEQDIFFMIEAMESWLIADIESIAKRHQNVKPEAAIEERVRVKTQVETIPKLASAKAIKNSLPSAWTKGRRMELMALLDPEIVMKLAPDAEALILHLRSLGE